MSASNKHMMKLMTNGLIKGFWNGSKYIHFGKNWKLNLHNDIFKQLTILHRQYIEEAHSTIHKSGTFPQWFRFEHLSVVGVKSCVTDIQMLHSVSCDICIYTYTRWTCD